jgi:hypothetical protein
MNSCIEIGGANVGIHRGTSVRVERSHVVPEAIQYPIAVSQQPLRIPILGATADHSIFCPAASVGIESVLDVSGDSFHQDGPLDTKERAIMMVRRRAYTNYDWLRVI